MEKSNDVRRFEYGTQKWQLYIALKQSNRRPGG